MSKQVMVCGIDCHPGDENCNNYCNNDKSRPMAECPPEATEAMKIEAAKTSAHRALDAAARAWYEYAGLCEVGPDRVSAFEVYENVRNSRRL